MAKVKYGDVIIMTRDTPERTSLLVIGGYPQTHSSKASVGDKGVVINAEYPESGIVVRFQIRKSPSYVLMTVRDGEYLVEEKDEENKEEDESFL